MGRGLALALTTAATTAGMLAGAVAVDRLGGGEHLPSWGVALVLAALLTPTVVGLVVLRDRPRNRIGWILVAGPVPVALLALCDAYAAQAAGGGTPPPGTAMAGAVAMSLWPAFYAWPLAVAFAFPDGHLPSPRWRIPVSAVFSAVALLVVLLLIGSPRLEDGYGGGASPLHVPAADILEPLAWIAWGTMFAGLFLGVAAIVVRHRHSDRDGRLQVKWLAWSAGLIPLGLVVCTVSYAAYGGVVWVVPAVLLLAGMAISVSVGIAVTRHGLYEIDRIVNRTVVYGAVTIVLGGAFSVIVLSTGLLLGRGSLLGTAVATLTVTVAFGPLRRRVQREVDRRIARERYEGLRRMRAFEDAVRSGAAGPEGVEEALRAALGDGDLRVWLRLPRSKGYADVAGRLVPDPGARALGRTRVTRHGEELAVVVHDPALRTRPDLLRSVLDAAGLTIELARLRAEVRVQLTEVRASRRRILGAADDERRRLERDLHDGAQQRLVGLGVALRRMQRSLPGEALVLVPALDQAVDEVARAIADLRTIAAGLRPPRLDDGLAAALGDLARSSPMPVVVHVDAERIPPPLELVAYYTVCEAVTNAIKHASASRIEVEALRDGGRLVIRIRDDGAGGAVARGATGLAGVADRVGAHGGRLTIDSPPGEGTLLEAVLPCAS